MRAYLRQLVRFSPPRFLGHNPLGGWMVVALLAVVFAAALTGLISDGFFGPGIASSAGEVHEALGSVLQIMIVVHVAGVFLDWLLTGDNLIAAMISGRKSVETEIVDESTASSAPRDARGGSVWLALAIAVPLIALGGWLYGQIDPTMPRPQSGEHNGD